MTVQALAEAIDEKPVGVIKFLMTDLGVMASMTQNLDPATCVAVAEGFGRIVGEDDYDDDEDYEEYVFKVYVVVHVGLIFILTLDADAHAATQ